LEIGVSDVLKATMLKDAQKTAMNNEIARVTVAAEDIRENVTVSVDGLDLIVLMKVVMFALAKMNAEGLHEVYA
jgi:hypothetical protein